MREHAGEASTAARSSRGPDEAAGLSNQDAGPGPGPVETKIREKKLKTMGQQAKAVTQLRIMIT